MNTRSILIIADDLSGAADCAIAFAGAGRRTIVTLDASSALNAGTDADSIDVIAADTDTRRLAPNAAARRTADAFSTLAAPGRRLYKKIDSTLRGNWAAEVAALQPRAGLAIVAPAFPATGRTTHGARVLVHGEPLESTDTWKLENADRPANVQAMLEDAGLRCASIDVDTLHGDAEVLRNRIRATTKERVEALIVDAHTGDDLKRLAEITSQLDHELFWVGSGGLARELATLPDLFSNPPSEPLIHEKQHGPILVLVGSLSSVSERQCAMLRERAGIAELIVPPAVLRQGAGAESEHSEWREWQSKIADFLVKRIDLLVRIGRDDAFDPAEGAHLSNALAALVAPHFEHVGGLIATGGETARAMLSATGIGSLDLLAEVEAGVAVARPSAPLASRPAIVTKAGAFGSEHALFGAWEHLQRLPLPTTNTH
ncbi:Hrp-dependent type III effector protein [Burkholderia sp. PAMC 28687]|uniref:four-carbon acid sugar kinase family protein n=1 Tax=Burkholderia sp. PAMC 28687 TaxID=1795874 RepID=UPI0007843D82|nr:four-carbon acid sugar kinase family protein [Burkholderia sp. PAMC 28687]AMM17554.1 Hrp-dependent type III effector protein [Burkholderia sp. PAMC 28687]